MAEEKSDTGIRAAGLSIAAKALEQGIASLLLLVVFAMIGAGVHYYLWPIAEVHIKSVEQERKEMSTFLTAEIERSTARAEALQKIAQAIQVEQETNKIMASTIAAEQDTNQKILIAQEGTLKALEVAQEAMKDVPAERREQTALLKEIRDGIKELKEK